MAFIVFNRPELTARVLAAIRAARPPRLFVVADGPRADRPGEVERCAAVRALIEVGIDWPCVVEKNYAESNLGCGRRVSSGLDWVFARVEEAIILEDDCLPDASFFPFCEELLARYREDGRVAQIGGTNHQYRDFSCAGSYFFSRYNHIWGWATWRRAWRLHDPFMRHWPEVRDHGDWSEMFSNRPTRLFWRARWRAVFAGKVDTWDLAWTFSCIRLGLLTALPAVSLVENLGFSPDATHTKRGPARPLRVGRLEWPLRHPETLCADADADAHMERILFHHPSILQRVWRRITR